MFESYQLNCFAVGAIQTRKESALAEKIQSVQEENDILKQQVGAYKAELSSHLLDEAHNAIPQGADNSPLGLHPHSVSSSSSGPCSDKVQ